MFNYFEYLREGIYYRPQKKLWEGNVFTPVYHSLHEGGGRIVCLPTQYHGAGRQTPSIGRSPIGSGNLTTNFPAILWTLFLIFRKIKKYMGLSPVEA